MIKHSNFSDNFFLKIKRNAVLDSYCVFLFCPATRDAIESACRCMFGVELVDMSLFYFLMYVQAAGGMDPLISAKPNMGQEFRVSVRICLMIFCNDQHLRMSLISLFSKCSHVQVLMYNVRT